MNWNLWENTMSGKIKVTIDRAKWRTGDDGLCRTGLGRTQLRNKEGFQCCLGFIVAQTRPELPILGIEDPEGCACTIEGLTYEVAGWPRNTKLVLDAMTVNDNKYISLAEREQWLLELFEDSPYELEFVGEYNERKD